jgi:hypothetical protein
MQDIKSAEMQLIDALTKSLKNGGETSAAIRKAKKLIALCELNEDIGPLTITLSSEFLNPKAELLIRDAIKKITGSKNSLLTKLGKNLMRKGTKSKKNRQADKIDVIWKMQKKNL